LKILVVSDSHGAVDALTKAIEANIHVVVQHVFHLGDGCDDMDVFVCRYPNVIFHVLQGNCDMFSSSGISYPNKLIVDVEGKKILAAHGHKYGVKTSYDRMCYAALEAGADICLFGHTHAQTNFEYEGIQFVNPGAIYQHGKTPNYAIIDISDNSVSVRLNPLI